MIDTGKFLKLLVSENIQSCVMWGYSTLPNKIEGTDIDLLISPFSIQKLFELCSDYFGVQPVLHREYSGFHQLQSKSMHSHYLLGKFDIWTSACLNTEKARGIGPRGEREELPLEFSRAILDRRRLFNGFYVSDPTSQAALTLLRIWRDKAGNVTPEYRTRILKGKEFGNKEMMKMLLLALGGKQIPDSIEAMLNERNES